MEIRYDLLETSERELEREIGRALTAGRAGALPLSAEELEAIARQWIGSRTERVRQALCGNDTVRRLAAGGFSTELVAAVSALVESLVLGTAGSPLVILLCRRGLRDLCSAEWTDTA